MKTFSDEDYWENLSPVHPLLKKKGKGSLPNRNEGNRTLRRKEEQWQK